MTSNDEAPLWVFGDQLGPHVHAAHAHREVVLVESAAALRCDAAERDRDEPAPSRTRPAVRTSTA